MITIGVDYHPSFQTIAFLMEETGEHGEQELNDSNGANWHAKVEETKAQVPRSLE